MDEKIISLNNIDDYPEDEVKCCPLEEIISKVRNTGIPESEFKNVEISCYATTRSHSTKTVKKLN